MKFKFFKIQGNSGNFIQEKGHSGMEIIFNLKKNVQIEKISSWVGKYINIAVIIYLNNINYSNASFVCVRSTTFRDQFFTCLDASHLFWSKGLLENKK